MMQCSYHQMQQLLHHHHWASHWWTLNTVCCIVMNIIESAARAAIGIGWSLKCIAHSSHYISLSFDRHNLNNLQFYVQVAQPMYNVTIRCTICTTSAHIAKSCALVCTFDTMGTIVLHSAPVSSLSLMICSPQFAQWMHTDRNQRTMCVFHNALHNATQFTHVIRIVLFYPIAPRCCY